MFQPRLDGEHLTINYNNHVVLDDINLSVLFDTSKSINLRLIEQNKEQKSDHLGHYTCYQFSSIKDDRTSSSLLLNCYEDFVLAYMDVSVLSERSFARNDYLASERGVAINVKNMGDIQGLIAHYRHKDWWTRPYFHTNLSKLPSRTQSLLWHNGDAYYQVLPVCDSIFKSEIVGANEGFDISISSYDGGRDQCHTLAFVLGRDVNPFQLAKKLTETVTKKNGATRPIEEKRYPKTLNYLGWCSWDAFYQEVNEKGILEKAKELQSKQVPVKWMMIDDGWSETREGCLNSFEADANKFPQGLNTLTNQLKNTYNVASIGVWHTLAGYWGGIDPESSLSSELSGNLYKTNSRKFIPYPDLGKGYGFWNAWHSSLKQQGIDFVKVDGQSAINNFMRQELSVGESARESHKALEASVGIHFDHCMINCMGMAPENVWNRPISSVSRSSDDFVPDDDNGLYEHAIQNVYNSFYHGELYWGDWDMFWTMHKDAKRHALLRAVSGGPIYTSDPVGKTDKQVIDPLIYRDGQILRCDHPGRPTADTLMKDPTQEEIPLKIWNKSNGAGILAVYNLQQKQVQGAISPSDVEELQADEYIVYDFFNEKIYEMGLHEKQSFSLDKEEHALFIVIPKEHPFTPIGLLDKYITPHTFSYQYMSEEKMVVRLREGGTFAFTSDREPTSVTVNGQSISHTRLNENESIYVIDCTSYSESLLVELTK